MKKILLAATAATALVGVAAPATAQTNTRHYAGAEINVGGFTFGPTLNNPQNLEIFGIDVGDIAVALADAVVENTGYGTRYTASTSAQSDSKTATPVVNTSFKLSGTVNADCSFYAGNDDSALDINFGVIGIRTGDNENVNQAFEMVDSATAAIETLTAGCNTNNRVQISKDDLRGLVNAGAGAYDTNEFQANIPYSVTASWTGVPQGGAAAGTVQTLVLDTNSNFVELPQGAWRSSMTIDISAPVAAKGLVAGTYEGTTTVTLTTL